MVLEKDIERFREDLIALSLVPGIGPAGMSAFLEKAGTLGKARGMSDSAIKALAGRTADPAMIREAAASKSFFAETGFMKENSVIALIPADERYPVMLREIHDPPPLLFVMGELRPEDNSAVAIVGSRRCTLYGMRMAERLAYDLASSGVTVVSGMARGIDSAAHRGALKAGGRTIAVLGSGLGDIYPPESKGLAGDIAASGAVLTEFPSATPPLKHNFPRRNRIVSGLSAAVIVVEAGEKSGALITADMALDQGRDVLAVPGQADSASSRGSNRLLKNGAGLVTSADDVLEAIGYQARPAQDPGRAQAWRGKPLEPQEEMVMRALEAGEKAHIDDICEVSGLGTKARDTLVKMELKGLLKAVPGGFYTRSGKTECLKY